MTEGPHMYYVDPENMVLKGEIPWSPSLRVEAKNFKTYFVHTVSGFILYVIVTPKVPDLGWISLNLMTCIIL